LAPGAAGGATTPAPQLALVAGGKLLLVANGSVAQLGPVATGGLASTMTVTGFEWSSDGRYLAWQQINLHSGNGADGATAWYDTVTHRKASWPVAYQASVGWSVTAAGVQSLAAGQDLKSPATLTKYTVGGAVTHQSVTVRTSLTVAGYSGGFVIGPDIVSNSQLYGVSLSGHVTKLQALPKPAPTASPYEMTASSPDGKVFVAEQGDHTDGCGVGPASRIFVINEATGTIKVVPLPAGPKWRVLSFGFDPGDAVDVTLVDCTMRSHMATSAATVSTSGDLVSLKEGTIVSTRAGANVAFQPGYARLGGTEAPVIDLTASAPLVLDGHAVPRVRSAAIAEFAP
jgi:hypothetical protein